MQVIVADPSFNFPLLQKLGEKSNLKFTQLPLPLNTDKLSTAFALFIRTRVKLIKSFYLKLQISK